MRGSGQRSQWSFKGPGTVSSLLGFTSDTGPLCDLGEGPSSFCTQFSHL